MLAIALPTSAPSCVYVLFLIQKSSNFVLKEDEVHLFYTHGQPGLTLRTAVPSCSWAIPGSTSAHLVLFSKLQFPKIPSSHIESDCTCSSKSSPAIGFPTVTQDLPHVSDALSDYFQHPSCTSEGPGVRTYGQLEGYPLSICLSTLVSNSVFQYLRMSSSPKYLSPQQRMWEQIRS